MIMKQSMKYMLGYVEIVELVCISIPRTGGSFVSQLCGSIAISSLLDSPSYLFKEYPTSVLL